MASQLEKDIERRINERLKVWAKDSVELCDMADIPHMKSAMFMASAMLTFLTIIFVGTNSDPDEVGEMMSEVIKAAKQLREHEKAQALKEAESGGMPFGGQSL